MWRQTFRFVDLKRIPHIRESLLSWKIDLRRRVADAPEQRCDRWSEMDGELMRLVEPAPEFAPGMERHRHHAIGIGQHRRAGLTHQRAQPRRNRLPAIVLERVDDLGHPPLVGIHRRTPRDRMRCV